MRKTSGKSTKGTTVRSTMAPVFGKGRLKARGMSKRGGRGR